MPITRPEDTHHAFARAANAASINELLSLYEPGAAIVERDGRLSVGMDAIAEHLRHLLDMRPRMSIVETRAFQNGDIALLCSRWKASIDTPGGVVELESRGSEIVRRQQDGTWRLTLDNPWGIDVATA
jgi:uncharacterized protein (TIGR02246 family)